MTEAQAASGDGFVKHKYARLDDDRCDRFVDAKKRVSPALIMATSAPMYVD